MKNLGEKIKFVLGIESYRNSSDVVAFLNGSTPTFSLVDCFLLEQSPDMRIWIVTSEFDVFVVRDNGFELHTLLRRTRADFDFSIVEDYGAPRLYINDTITTLPINFDVAGDSQILGNRLNLIKSTHAVTPDYPTREHSFI